MAKNALQQSILNKASEDKFLLVFDIPPILKSRNRHFNQSNVNFIKESVQFSISKTTVPEITVPAVEIRDVGSTLYVSSHSKNSYPPVTVEFKIDNEYKNYWTIYKWLNLLHDEKLGHYNADEIGAIHNSMDDYQTDLTIFGMDEFNNKRIKFIYKKAFPTTLESIQYDYQATDELISGFTFVYSQMHVEVLDF